MSRQTQTPSAKYLAFWLGLLLFALYWLGFSGRVYIPPGRLIQTGPLFNVAGQISIFNPVHLTLMANSAMLALSAAILLLWLTELGQRRAVSAGLTLLYGLGIFILANQYLFSALPLLLLSLLLIIWAGRRALKQKGLLWPAIALLAGAGFIIALWQIIANLFGGWSVSFAPALWQEAGNGYLLIPGAIVLLMALLNLWPVFRGHGQGYPPPLIALLLTLFLVGQFMLASAHTVKSQTPLNLIKLVEAQAQTDDILLVAGDDSRLVAAVLAVKPSRVAAVFADILPASLSNRQRVWLLEPKQAEQTLYNQLNQTAFWIRETQVADEGKLSLFALSQADAEAIPLNIPFEGDISLQNFSLYNSQASPGQTLNLQLNWQTDGTEELMLFAQLLPETDPAQITAQQDRLLPLEASTGVQRLGLLLPPTTPPGNYLLIVGLYNAQTGQRLHRTDGSPDDFLYLTTVQVVK